MEIGSERPISPKIQRVAVGAMFFLQGLAFASWASRIPTIQQKLDLNEAALGLVLLALPAGLMLSLPLSGWLVAKAGSKTVLTFSISLYSVVLVSIGLTDSVLQLMLSLFAFGLVGNMVNISVNTQAVGVEAMYKRSIMASFHGLWSLAGFLGAAFGTLMIASNIIPFYHFLTVSVVSYLVLFFSLRFTVRKDISSTESTRIFVIPDRSMLHLGLITFCAMICEGAMFDWSGIYFRKIVQPDKFWIGAGYTAFMFTMASGRFLADSFTHRFGLKFTLFVSGLLIAGGLMLAVLLPNLPAALAGFLLVGFGTSSIVPLVYGIAGRSRVMPAGVALAAVSTIGFLGFLLGPPLIGIIAGYLDLRFSFSMIALMGLCITMLSSVIPEE